jgi:hypothetical protein
MNPDLGVVHLDPIDDGTNPGVGPQFGDRPVEGRSPRFRCHSRQISLRSSWRMTVIAMSRKKIDGMHVLRDLDAKRITVSEAAQVLLRST